MKAILRSRGVWLATLAVVALGAGIILAAVFDENTDWEAVFDKGLYSYYMAQEVQSLDEIVSDFESEQAMYLPIAIPEPDFIHVQSGGILPFNPKNFPVAFCEGLVPVEEGAIVMYPITVYEDPKTRDRIVLNAKNEAIGVVPAAKDYDPQWYVTEQYPALLAMGGDYADWLVAMYDPSRIVITYKLILEEDLIKLVWKQSIEAAARAEEEGGGMMMLDWEGGSVSNLQFVAIEAMTNGAIELTIAWPQDGLATNMVDFFACTNLMVQDWGIALTTNVDLNTNCFSWVDEDATNYTVRFYDCWTLDDTDGDGISDGREKRLYGSEPNDIDSDGDGLVDGYSGVVSTNSYPGGAYTNGGAYVEGELTWGTDQQLFDTDGDGMGDGWEVANGHDPLDPNDPPNVLGTIFYSGRQTGTVWVVAVTSSGSWSTNYSKTLSAPGAYQIPNLPGTDYWLKAWMDSNGNSATNAAEAWGTCVSNPVLVTNQVTGKDITLTDPDSDSDGLPDWWEVQYFGSITNWTGSGDPDADQYTNQEEYEADTDPTDEDSHPWNISGTITYSGPQTGTIYVVACTSSTGWEAAQYTTISAPGAYAITHLPPNADYWVKAWRDTSGDGTNTFWEAWGAYTSNPVYLGPNASGADIALADPDSDGDTLPDWWEVAYGLDPLNGNGANAAAWWKLDEGSGTNVQDSTANTNNGVLCNAPSNAWTCGVMSNAVSFNGTSAYAQFQDCASLKPNFVSVSLWIKPAQDYTNGAAVFFSKKQPTGATGYRLSYENGALSFLICASGNKSVSLPYSLTNGVWHHVVGTYGGATHRLYVDGVLCVSTNYDWGTGFGYIDQGTTAPRIAASTDATPSNYFAGIIDDARVYDRELASNEVHAVYELGADVDGDGLSAWQEYQEGTSPTDPDDPPNVAGTVAYTGMQTGTIYVLAAAGATEWIAERSTARLTPGPYQIANLSPSVYWIKAYRDSDGDGSHDTWEPSGLFASNPLVVTGRTTGIDIALSDPDLDGDGMPDWQEMAIVNANTNDAIETVDHVFEWADFDGDGVSNGEEIRLGTDPNSSNSVPPVLRFSTAQTSVSESASNVVVSIVLLPAASDTVQATLSVVGGNANNGSDYAFTNQIVTFSAAETNQNINVPIFVNEPGETPESIVFKLDGLSGPAALGTPSQMAVWITDSFADSDSDGLPDAWEIQFFGNLDQGAGGDPDGDSVNNLTEFRQGRHPMAGAVADTNNVLKLNVITPLR